MNHIEVKRIKTRYDYYENYFVIDGVPITASVERHKSASLAVFGSLLGLLPAWGGNLISPWENDFVRELIECREELNVPILVCEDDCDLSCIVIVAHIRKAGHTVYWDKIGSLDHSGIDPARYEESGILCLEAYTDADWEKYGDNIATEKYGSPAYWKWVNENCYEEHMRRLRNYLKPYMQNDENIEWLWSPCWEFEEQEYQTMLSQYYLH